MRLRWSERHADLLDQGGICFCCAGTSIAVPLTAKRNGMDVFDSRASSVQSGKYEKGVFNTGTPSDAWMLCSCGLCVPVFSKGSDHIMSSFACGQRTHCDI